MNRETLYILGGIASVVLLILYFWDSGNSGPSVNPTFEVVGQTPETAAIGAQVRIAQIGANAEMIGDYFNYLTVADTNRSGVDINRQNVDASVTIAQGNNDLTKTLGLAGFDLQRNKDQLEFTQLTQQTTLAADLGKRALIEQGKASSRAAWGNVFGGIFGAIGKIFGL